MAIIRKNELNQMNKQALDSKLNDIRRELMRINSQISAGTIPENPGRIKEMKRTIARILTLERKMENKQDEEVSQKV